MGKNVFEKGGPAVSGGAPAPKREEAEKELPSVKKISENDIASLAKLAQELYDSAQEAQRQGDWALYGEKIKELGNVISELEERSKK